MTGTSFTRQVKRAGARTPRSREPALALDFCGDAAGLLPRLARGESDGVAAFLAVAQPEDWGSAAGGQGFRLYPHQEYAVRRVLGEFGGRALLADAVGLGKTIEAAAVLAEYRRRGLVERALLLVPAALVPQWERELAGRFGLKASVATTPAGWRGEVVLGSLDLAKRPAHAQRLCQTPWDLVIVDEAHRLKNQKTAAWQLVHQLEATYLLLLTATPVQNDLSELYSLVHLVRPGLLSTGFEFKRAFQVDRLHPKDPGLLRERLSQVMIRSDRRAAALCFPPRRVETLLLPQSEAEAELYADCLALLAEARRRSRTRQQVLPFVVLLREATSSPEAARRTLLRMARRPGLPLELAARYREVAERSKKSGSLKAETLGRLLLSRPGKAIVFTEFRGTQDLLARQLRQLSIPAVKYHGGMTAAAQEEAVAAFRREARVLVATEAGAEGHNLQFCRWLINFDLPWNPMRLEQRIGRVHRLGQPDPVEVTNLATEGTIEGHVLRILGAKLEQCEAVLGELDLILDHGCERRITDLVLAAETPADLEDAFARFAREIEARRAAFAAAAQRSDALAGLGADSGVGGRPAERRPPVTDGEKAAPAYLFLFGASLCGPLWREERVAVAVERRRGRWRVVEAGPVGALDSGWWARVETGAGPAVAVRSAEERRTEGDVVARRLAGDEGTGGREAGGGEAAQAYALAVGAARARLAAVAAQWASELTARRAAEEGWLLGYYQRRLTEELRGLKRTVHQMAVLQVRIALAQRAATLQQFQRELAGWEKALVGQLEEKRGAAGTLARELGRRYRELERRYQGEAKVSLVGVAYLPGADPPSARG